MSREGAVDSARKLVKDYGVAVVAAVLIALGIRFFVIEAYRIPTQAMRPALEAGDTIFVSKWSFGLRMPGVRAPLTAGRPPRYGEVVVYALSDEPGRDYIKRVVGLAGDVVEVRKGRLILNGKDVAQAAGKNAICGQETLPGAGYEVCWEPPLAEEFGPEKVPIGSVFVLGDLRAQLPEARKHRSWGLIPVAAVKARALWIWLSIEPAGSAIGSSWFSRIRFERMFRTIH